MTGIFLVAASLLLGRAPQPDQYFRINVLDDQTGRGVPLVELETTNNIRYYTDSAGVVAFYEPGLMDQTIFFTIRSHGYEFPKDGFGISGTRVKTTPGGHVDFKIKRINVAERLYRITGGGIYRDSVLLGLPVPIKEPVLNAQVFGQDSIQNAFYHGQIYWFWGDTNWISYPLGNFNMSGAVSKLPKDGGLDPDKGVDLRYYTRPDGFAKGVAPVPGPGPTWMGPILVLKTDGRERMLGPYNKIKDASMATYERGLAEWNDQKEEFEKTAQWQLDHPARPGGAPLIARGRDGEHVYFCTPFPVTRVRPDPDLLKDLSNFEMFTCLKEGTRVKDAQLDRDEAGRLRYSWKKNTPIVNQQEQIDLVKAGKMKTEEGLIQLADIETGKTVLAHGGSIYWNKYRKRWICIYVQVEGTSYLGELWYAEAPTPLGPWVETRKVATHNHYTFYNPLHHPFFDQQDGRVIYFEGTYCNTFSGNPYQTPRYDYNQMMYRLDLADPRLIPTHNDAKWMDSSLSAKRQPATRPAMEPELLRDWKMQQLTP